MNKNPNYGLFAVAVAVALVGAVWLGVPLGTLAPLAIVLVCPLMMMFMMRGMHDGDHGGGSEHHHPADRQNHDSTSPR
jgi:hypothetical protein